jgi:hypothetical protein
VTICGTNRGLDQPVIENWLGILRMQRHAKDVSILRLLTGRRKLSRMLTQSSISGKRAAAASGRGLALVGRRRSRECRGSNRAIRVLSPACFPSRLTAKLSMRLWMRERREGSTTTTLDLLGCALRTALGQIGSIRRRPHERLWSKLSRTGVTRKGHGHIDFCQHDPPSPRIFLAVRTAASPLGGPLFSAGSHC